MNYALSRWILNLGVLPLLRSCALRFLPALLRLVHRLLYVARFLETISPPFCWLKVFLLCFVFFVKIPLYAGISPPAIILALGGHREIPAQNMEKFTVGNKRIISYKLRFSPKRILIKGKNPGFTELMVWSRKKIKKIYPVYVISRQHQLSILPTGQLLQSMGLSTELLGSTLVVEGILQDVDSYLLLKKLQKEYGRQLHLRGDLSKALRNRIIGEVYYHFFKENLEQIECSEQNYDVVCHYPDSPSPGPALLQHLTDYWGVKLISLKNENRGKNLLAKAKILLMERLDGGQLGLGLHHLTGNLGSLFTRNGLHSIIKKNKVLMSKRKIRLSILAEPEIVLRPGKKAVISVGAEIPYNSISWQQGSEVRNTHWKFAGLKITFLLKKSNAHYELEYTTQFTRPSDGGVVGGNKEKSTVAVKLNQPFKLFQIGLKTKDQNDTSMPWLSNIPLLGSVFTSQSSHVNYKKISGVIILEEHGFK